jgi:hypothetical protein
MEEKFKNSSLQTQEGKFQKMMKKKSNWILKLLHFQRKK